MSNTLIEEQSKLRERRAHGVAEPHLFDVVLFNDNITPMEFVVTLLMSMYGHEQTRAGKIMMQIHVDGTGIAGTYPFDIAEAKVVETTAIARKSGFPLQCVAQKRVDAV